MSFAAELSAESCGKKSQHVAPAFGDENVPGFAYS